MKKRHFLCLFLLARCVAADDAPPVDTKTVLAELKEMQTKQSKASSAQLNKILTDFMSASSSDASAIEFYKAALKTTTVAGETQHTQYLEWKDANGIQDTTPKDYARAQQQFQDYRKKEAEKFKDPILQEAVRLHLAYLVLTVQRAAGAKIPQLIPALINYTHQLDACDPTVLENTMMKTSVTDSLFTHWYGISQMFAKLDGWQTMPGDVDGIWTTTILPQMRQDKDPRVLDYWDAKIQREATKASTRVSFKADDFNMVQRPTLLWSRSLDMLAIDQHNRAIREMLGIIKTYPNHVENGNWITQLQAVLSGSALPVQTASSPTASPTATPQ